MPFTKRKGVKRGRRTDPPDLLALASARGLNDEEEQTYLRGLLALASARG